MNSKHKQARGVVLFVVALAALGGCTALTRAEAAEALDEAGLAAEASALVSGTVEIGTEFTIGDAAAAAADELRTFVEAQLPCAEATLDGPTLTIVYGATGRCLYRGQAYTGSHSITVMRNEMDDVVVSHEWDRLANDRVEVSGSATVTWSAADPSRHVVHELTWTRLSDGRTGVGSGDRIQRPLEGGLLEGFSVEGTRAWEGDAGRWDLAIAGVEMRWIDPVPQAGSYMLTTPANKLLSLAFSRQDSTTIQVTLASGARSYDFDVVTLPSE